VRPQLYLETNFLLSFAYGQNRDSESLLNHIETTPIDVVLPEVCITEAIASWRNRRSRLLQVTEDYGEHQRELGRWDSVSASEASDMFRDLPVKLELAHSAARTRLFDCLRRLQVRSRLIAGDPAWLDPAKRIGRMKGDLDDYICSAIIVDAPAQSPAYFLSENKDFHEPSVVGDLGAVGVTVVKTPLEALGKYS
jgi:predicted nucleic acid-binding protein